MAAPTPGSSPDRSRATSTPAERHILLLEDNRELTAILKEYLESLFYRVTAVQNGTEGLRAVLASDFDIIVCDMVMPTMPGDMFYQAVQCAKPHLCERFIFITGHRGNPKLNEFLSQMASRVLYKPFHLDDLLDAILEIIRESEPKKPTLEPPSA